MREKTFFKKFLPIIILFVVTPANVYSQKDQELYYQAVQLAREKEVDIAFSYFDLLLHCFPNSKFREESLFAVGEYYFSISAYTEARESFERFIKRYSHSPAKIFALSYLLKISQQRNDYIKVKELEKQIIKFQQTSLVFREFKKLQYLSPFLKQYRALYFIDHIEVYVDEDLLVKINF
ncbi:MAG: hypothetical protein B6D56_01470 [Candidatus Omnitrophica bacterium 4484_70.1]|nr:MAG: hypothetical protein B6D56_01470 [Candidatus Omnitrophica bacterium 4484_70.1]